MKTFVHKLRRLLQYIRKFGIIKGTKLVILFQLSRDNAMVRVTLPKLPHPFWVRKGTSDVYVFNQLFLDGEYDTDLVCAPKLVIDGGANVGYASIIFANRYPEAKVIAIEPDYSNYEMLKRNTEKYHNIQTIRAGIWSRQGFLRVKDIGLGKWGCVVEVSDGEGLDDVKAVTIEEILFKSGCDRIDLLKLDIEGSEKEIFSQNYKSWLGKVGVLIIELHDRIESGCSDALFSAIDGYDFTISQEAEHFILRSKGG